MPTISSPCKPTTSPPIIFGNIYSGKVAAKNILAIEQQDEEKHFLRNEIYLFHTLETMFRKITEDPSQKSISSSLSLISAFFLFNLSQTPEPALVIVTAGPGPIGNCTTLCGKTTKWGKIFVHTEIICMLYMDGPMPIEYWIKIHKKWLHVFHHHVMENRENYSCWKWKLVKTADVIQERFYENEST